MSVGILVALVTGVAIASQVAIVGRTSARVHPLAISFALQASGLLVGFGWVFWSRSWPSVGEVLRAWWWIPLGVVGWVVVAALGFSSARVGTGATLALAITAQVITGLTLDRLSGSFELGLPQIAGALLLVAGAVLVAWR
ncbi:MAG: DMT family transporter [Candidatus Limnocylindrales bacterium]